MLKGLHISLFSILIALIFSSSFSYSTENFNDLIDPNKNSKIIVPSQEEVKSIDEHTRAYSDSLTTPSVKNRELLGKVNLDPEGVDFNKLSLVIKQSVRNISELPAVESNNLKLEEVVDLRHRGLGHESMQFGILKVNGVERKVIVKYFSKKNRNEINFFNEGFFTLLLNKVGLCPEFFGVLKNNQGGLAHVFEYVEGVNLEDAPVTWFTPKTLATLLEAGRRIRATGIKNTFDMQFMINSQGEMTLIDVEFFSFEVPIHFIQKFPREKYEPFGVLAETQRAIRARIQLSRFFAP